MYKTQLDELHAEFNIEYVCAGKWLAIAIAAFIMQTAIIIYLISLPVWLPFTQGVAWPWSACVFLAAIGHVIRMKRARRIADKAMLLIFGRNA